MGTPHYMSPEQARGHRVGPASDLYSLALTLFELVMGQPAYQASSPYELAMHHLTPDPLQIPSILASTRLGFVIKTGAEKSLADRYESAEAMLDDLTDPTRDVTAPRLELTAEAERGLFGDEGDTEETAAVPDSVPPTGEWPGKRRRKVVALSIGALIAVAAVAGIAFWGDDTSDIDGDGPAAESAGEPSDTSIDSTPVVVAPETPSDSVTAPTEPGTPLNGAGAAATETQSGIDQGVASEGSPVVEPVEAQEEDLEASRESRRQRESRRDRDRRREEQDRTATVTVPAEEEEVAAVEEEGGEQEQVAVVEESEETEPDPPEEVDDTPSLMAPVVGPSDGIEPLEADGSNDRPSELPINF